MRFLLIDDDPRYRALLRHHISCDLTDAELIVHNPVQRGSLEKDFLAQGYAAVLIDHAWQNGNGLDWLKILAHRPGFAPLVFLAPQADGALAERALEAGAFAVIGTDKIDHDRLIAVLRDAHRRQSQAQAEWLASPAARTAQTFGGAYIPGYRCARKIASG
ncbi:MAG: response regulator, partial [Steroidobacteraceae bacterium]|nr:response regulator [Steroidobacteraceae bacterium]MDW8260488.1 response regulator [Gammaproteobacteria bacterium]